MKGTVKFFNESKGFGFITAEDGKDYFVHITGLNEGVRLAENDAVTFEVVDGDRGPKAENVSKDDGSDTSGAEESADEDADDADDSSDDSEDDAEKDSADF